MIFKFPCYCIESWDVLWVRQAETVIGMTITALSAVADAGNDVFDGQVPPDEPVLV